MTLPYAEAISDAARQAGYALRDEGEKPTVVLLNPSLAEKFYLEVGLDPEELRADLERCPTIGLLRLIEDDSIPEDEVCVLSDERYLEHIRAKLEAEEG